MCYWNNKLDWLIMIGDEISMLGRRRNEMVRQWCTTGVGSGGYAGDLTPQLFMWRGYWYVYPPPLEKPNIANHANCMQHVLRCWERQSDGSEYEKTLRQPGLRPGPRWGSLQRFRKPPSWWGWAGCPLLRTPSPLSALRASPLLPPLQN